MMKIDKASAPLILGHDAVGKIAGGRGKRFVALSGQARIACDRKLAFVEESARHKRGAERDA